MTKGGVITISAVNATAQQDGEQGMNGIRKRSLFGVFGLLFGGATHPAWADTPQAAAEPKLEEVLVTAQKKSERLQDVPVTINCACRTTTPKSPD